jgi:hypothetical protein
MAWAFSRVPGKTVEVVVDSCLIREIREKRGREESNGDNDASEEEDFVSENCALLIMREKNRFEFHVNFDNRC